MAWQPAVAAWRWPIGTAVRRPRVAEPVVQPEFGGVYHERILKTMILPPKIWILPYFTLMFDPKK